MIPYRLTPKARSDIRRLLALQTKTLGETLREADIVSANQIESALKTQDIYPNLRLGEILAQQDLIQPVTADFFVQDWTKIVLQSEKDALGFYLQQAGILKLKNLSTSVKICVLFS